MSEKMAQRVVLFLLWLFGRSSAGFPNQINIGKCFAIIQGYRLWLVRTLCMRLQEKKIVPERFVRSAELCAMIETNLILYSLCCKLMTANSINYVD